MNQEYITDLDDDYMSFVILCLDQAGESFMQQAVQAIGYDAPTFGYYQGVGCSSDPLGLKCNVIH